MDVRYSTFTIVYIFELNMDFLMEFSAYCIRLKTRIIKFFEQICRTYNEEEEWYPNEDLYSIQCYRYRKRVLPSTPRRQHENSINPRMTYVTRRVILAIREQREQDKNGQEQQSEQQEQQEKRETEHISEQPKKLAEERSYIPILKRPLDVLFADDNWPQFSKLSFL
ncbi:uncharacterized protein LOC116843849 [Odontomachus brunneus]|uniref:uncharacterized protein LOC116843849 n=1 Tax=Odontomachus brunneus TaxID=486640 RepID=UPI0013F18529|nr:uncharacterized protein LOC116843849 [Odontomachus brunneus]